MHRRTITQVGPTSRSGVEVLAALWLLGAAAAAFAGEEQPQAAVPPDRKPFWRAPERLPRLRSARSRAEAPRSERRGPYRGRLTGAVMHRAKLTNAKLDHAKLQDANLNKSDMKRASLAGADLTGVLLYGTDLSGANLEGVVMPKAHMAHVRLVHAVLRGADVFLLSTMTDAEMADSDLSHAETLSNRTSTAPTSADATSPRLWPTVRVSSEPA